MNRLCVFPGHSRNEVSCWMSGLELCLVTIWPRVWLAVASVCCNCDSLKLNQSILWHRAKRNFSLCIAPQAHWSQRINQWVAIVASESWRNGAAHRECLEKRQHPAQNLKCNVQLKFWPPNQAWPHHNDCVAAPLAPEQCYNVWYGPDWLPRMTMTMRFSLQLGRFVVDAESLVWAGTAEKERFLQVQTNPCFWPDKEASRMRLKSAAGHWEQLLLAKRPEPQPRPPPELHWQRW